MDTRTGHTTFGALWNGEFVRLALMGTAALFTFTGLGNAYIPYDFVAIIATLLGGIPVYEETIRSLRHKRITMEVTMTIAIVASLIIRAFTAAVIIAFFVLLAEYIEEYAVDRARNTVFQLEKAAPRTALVRRGNTEVEVGVDTLSPGDIVIVRLGDRIPVDGTVVTGDSFVNQSMITGESIPAEKHPGDNVYAGSVNDSGLVEVRAEKIGTETVFGKIIKLVEEAEQKKAPIQRISDKLATWLVEFAIGFAFLTLLATQNSVSAISVVVVAGSCGVAAGTPLAIVAIMGKAAKKGVIVKGGSYIEELTRIDTAVIDKTGTLTLGKPEVIKVEALDGYSEGQVLALAAAAEKHSNHPIAQAIVQKAGEMQIAPIVHSTYKVVPGMGIISEHDGQQILVGNPRLMKDNGIDVSKNILSQSVKGATTVLVAHDHSICGVISLADKVRQESKKAITDLKRMGIRTVMLTGDNEAVSKMVADTVGVDEVYAQLLPHDKVTKIEELVAKGRHVAMVGDGINDAPALARANVGIGMGAGTDVAIEEADVVLMTNDLEKIANVIRMSRQGYRAIMENFYGTIGVDGIGVILAFMGLLNPLLAATIHTASELVFIVNSARLMR